MNTAKIEKTTSSDNRSGFALLLALALMSLVFLLVVTLITYVGAELRLTDFRKQKIVAESNARMGLMVAIGELQKHLGPDTRVTATADLLDERIDENKEEYTYNSSPSTGIDLNDDGDIDTAAAQSRNVTLIDILLSIHGKAKFGGVTRWGSHSRVSPACGSVRASHHPARRA